MTKCIIQC